MATRKCLEMPPAVEAAEVAMMQELAMAFEQMSTNYVTRISGTGLPPALLMSSWIKTLLCALGSSLALAANLPDGSSEEIVDAMRLAAVSKVNEIRVDDPETEQIVSSFGGRIHELQQPA